ncbi:MAG TPA: xanthine dehydrogenase family protein subunit M [Geminicoccaceae bacterium]
MTPFELLQPRSFREAIALLDPEDVETRPMAGGTAIMLMMKTGMFRPRQLVSLRGVEASYRRIEVADDGALRIGALTPLAALERSPDVVRHAPVIARTMRRLSNVRVRNVATIGGSLGHADPHMDLPPVLTALGAEVKAIGSAGERTIAVADLITDYYETVLRPDELVAEVRVPAQAGRRTAYIKMTARSADDWPAVGIAISLGGGGDAIEDARVVVSAATARPTRIRAAEEALRGGGDPLAAARRAGEAAAEEAEVIGDAHGSAAYKKQLIRVCVARAAGQALEAPPDDRG